MNNIKSNFYAGPNGVNMLEYEDHSCFIELPADDVRDQCIMVAIGNVIDKKYNREIKLTKIQKLEVYRRVSAVIKNKGWSGIYTDEYGMMEVNIDDIDDSKDILDIKEE